MECSKPFILALSTKYEVRSRYLELESALYDMHSRGSLVYVGLPRNRRRHSAALKA